MSDKKDMMFTILDGTPEEQKSPPKNSSICLQKRGKNNLCQTNLLILMKNEVM